MPNPEAQISILPFGRWHNIYSKLCLAMYKWDMIPRVKHLVILRHYILALWSFANWHSRYGPQTQRIKKFRYLTKNSTFSLANKKNWQSLMIPQLSTTWNKISFESFDYFLTKFVALSTEKEEGVWRGRGWQDKIVGNENTICYFPRWKLHNILHNSDQLFALSLSKEIV